MKIHREINGIPVDIALTEDELRSVYWDAKDAHDKENVLNIADWAGDREYYEMLRDDPRLLDRVARRYSRYLEDSVTGEMEFDCFTWAIEEVVEKGVTA